MRDPVATMTYLPVTAYVPGKLMPEKLATQVQHYLSTYLPISSMDHLSSCIFLTSLIEVTQGWNLRSGRLPLPASGVRKLGSQVLAD